VVGVGSAGPGGWSTFQPRCLPAGQRQASTTGDRKAPRRVRQPRQPPGEAIWARTTQRGQRQISAFDLGVHDGRTETSGLDLASGK